jgi:hypothetical protein
MLHSPFLRLFPVLALSVVPLLAANETPLAPSGPAAYALVTPVGAEKIIADLAAADEAFLSSSVAGVLPVTSFQGALIGDGRPGPWTLRARADREAMIAGEDAT